MPKAGTERGLAQADHGTSCRSCSGRRRGRPWWWSCPRPPASASRRGQDQLAVRPVFQGLDIVHGDLGLVRPVLQQCVCRNAELGSRPRTPVSWSLRGRSRYRSLMAIRSLASSVHRHCLGRPAIPSRPLLMLPVYHREPDFLQPDGSRLHITGSRPSARPLDARA